jgi:biotin carboxyl carrier protein
MLYEITLTDASGKSTDFKVDVRQGKDGAQEITVNGEPFPTDAANFEREVLSLISGARSYEARYDAARSEIAIAGQRFSVEVRDPRSLRSRKAAGGGTDGPKQIKAPMPGKVVRVIAPEGTEVEANQGIIVIEAMKMQNELKSPKKGKVAKILVAEGGTVNAGDALAVIE